MATHPLVVPSTSTRAFLDEHFATAESLDAVEVILNTQLYEWQEIEFQRLQLRTALAAATASALGLNKAESENVAGGLSDDTGFSPRFGSRSSSSARQTGQRTSETVGSILERAEEIKLQTSVNSAEVQPMIGELTRLAAEVAQCERIRGYLEVLLGIEERVGEIEELASSSISLVKRELAAGLDPRLVVGSQPLPNTWKNSKAVPSLWHAASLIATTSEYITTVARAHPTWSHMFLEASLQLDAATSSLLPHLRSCLRACLAASGWPPSLQLIASKPGADSAPLALMTPGSALAASFASLFVSTAVLQRSQELRERGNRPANHGATAGLTWEGTPSPSPPLWAMEELMAPVAEEAARMWAVLSPSSNGDGDGAVNPPQAALGLALALRVARQHASTLEDVLQPVIDNAGGGGGGGGRGGALAAGALNPKPLPPSSSPPSSLSLLRGCSAREEWVRAGVRQLAIEFLRRHVVGPLAASLEASPTGLLAMTVGREREGRRSSLGSGTEGEGGRRWDTVGEGEWGEGVSHAGSDAHGGSNTRQPVALLPSSAQTATDLMRDVTALSDTVVRT